MIPGFLAAIVLIFVGSVALVAIVVPGDYFLVTVGAFLITLLVTGVKLLRKYDFF